MALSSEVLSVKAGGLTQESHKGQTSVCPQAHVVQFYDNDERGLAASVGRYLLEGLAAGEGILTVATPEHTAAFLRQLAQSGISPGAAIEEGRLVTLDAAGVLERFMVDGHPDRSLFQKVLEDPIGKLRAANGGRWPRAYGEMVGLLWKARQFSAAICLEELWSEFLEMTGCRLYCAYPIDIFSREFHSPAVSALLSAHTHVIPSGDQGDLENAVSRAAEEVLGARAEGPRQDGSHSYLPPLPEVEAAILSLHHDFPESSDVVLARARSYYRSEKRFRALIENSFDAISLVDEQNNIVYASSSAERVLGYAPEDLIGRNGFDFVHPADVETARRTIKQLLAQPGSPMRMEVRVRRKDGRWCWVEGAASNLLDEPEVRAIVWHYRDISERKAAEEEKQHVAGELARSYEQLQAFAYAAAHDLKEPLRNVSAYAQLLAESVPANERTDRFAGIIVSSAKRMSLLLDDLLAFSSLDFTGEPQTFELREAAELALQNLKQAIDESSAEISFGVLPPARGTKGHMVQLFQNLIGNAIKYRDGASPEIRVTAEQQGSEWVVKVRDNGIGIAPKYHRYVFGVFKRLHGRETPGTGMGLAICKKIAEGMGGRIWVESGPQRGSTFCFTVPATRAE